MTALTIRRKIALGSLVLGGAFALQAGVTMLMEWQVIRSVAELEVTDEARQHHMQADMMHDAIRGAVYRELYLSSRGDALTQQNAAMVEQSTAAARSLADEASHLSELVSQFRLAESARAAARLPAARPVAVPAAPVRAAPIPAVHGNLALAGGEGDWAEF